MGETVILATVAAGEAASGTEMPRVRVVAMDMGVQTGMLRTEVVVAETQTGTGVVWVTWRREGALPTDPPPPSLRTEVLLP